MLKFLLIIPALLLIGLSTGCDTTDVDKAVKKAKMMDEATIKSLTNQLKMEKEKAKGLQEKLAAALKDPKKPKKDDKDKDDQPPPPDKANIAGVEVMKFVFQPENPIDDHAKKFKDITEAVKKLDFGKPDTADAITTKIEALDVADINAQDKVNKNASLLQLVMVPKLLAEKDADNVGIIKKAILVPLLKKGANPHLKDTDGMAFLEIAKATPDASPLLIETITYFEPNKSVRDALTAIGGKLDAAKDPDLLMAGATAVADLKALDPYFASPTTQALAAKVVAALEGDKLKDAKQVKNAAANALKNFKDLGKIDELPLEDALTVLLNLSNPK